MTGYSPVTSCQINVSGTAYKTELMLAAPQYPKAGIIAQYDLTTYIRYSIPFSCNCLQSAKNEGAYSLFNGDGLLRWSLTPTVSSAPDTYVN